MLKAQYATLIMSCLFRKCGEDMLFEVDLEKIRFSRGKMGVTKTKMAQALHLSGTEKYTRRESGEYKLQATEIPVLVQVFHMPMVKILALSLRKSKEEAAK
ncbi:helix-turn-helix domain-containing protein [Lacticaseibacillus paracasei]|uniref:helix-turn-helix domain-containing protein n=1 Tax=Lacticaseibacillus paracasei TaxID=1597 RepID=UPI001EF2C38E|nr:helix-turn-helix domain-containing protein [Lacticaseibacillus paracasei]